MWLRHLYVSVRPTSIELNGLKDYAYQGDEIVISCIVRGAKPVATIKWQNNTEPIQLSADTKFQNVVSKNNIYFPLEHEFQSR